MLSDQELSRVQALIDERERYITRIKGASETYDKYIREFALTAIYSSLRKVETELTELGVVVTPYEAVKGTP